MSKLTNLFSEFLSDVLEPEQFASLPSTFSKFVFEKAVTHALNVADKSQQRQIERFASKHQEKESAPVVRESAPVVRESAPVMTEVQNLYPVVRHSRETGYNIVYAPTTTYESTKYTQEVIDKLNQIHEKFPTNTSHQQRLLREQYINLTGTKVKSANAGRNRFEQLRENRNFYQVTFNYKVTVPGKGPGLPAQIINHKALSSVGVSKKYDPNFNLTKTAIQNLISAYANGREKGTQITMSYSFSTTMIISGCEIEGVFVNDLFKLDADANLTEIRMRNFNKEILQLGETESLNPNKGQCVIDYLRSQLLVEGSRHQRSLEIGNLIKFFDYGYQKLGVSIKQMAEFCEFYKISIRAFSSLGSLVYQKVYMQSRQSLCFVIQNNHLYPIEGPSKASVEHGGLKIFDYKFKTSYEEYIYMNKGDLSELMKKIMMLNKKDEFQTRKSEFKAFVFIVDAKMYDAHEVVALVQLNLRYHINEFKFDEGNIVSAFRLPGTRIIVEFSHHFEDRLATFDCARERLPEFFPEFLNQSYPQLSMRLFKAIESTSVFESHFNKRVRKSLIENRSGAYISTFSYDEELVKNMGSRVAQFALDIRKSYSTGALFSGNDFNQFNELDDIQVYDGRDFKQGFFYLEKPYRHETGFILQSEWYSHPMMEWLVNTAKLITKENISFMIIPQKMISYEVLQNYTALCYQLHPEHGKKFANFFYGCLGKEFRTESKGLTTPDMEEAHAYSNHMEQLGYVPFLTQQNSLYFIIGRKYILLEGSSIPVYQQIIDQGKIQLFQLMIDIKKNLSTQRFPVQFCGCNTDSVSVIVDNKSSYKNFAENYNLCESLNYDTDLSFPFLKPLADKYGKVDLSGFGTIKFEEFKIRGVEKFFADREEPKVEDKDFEIFDESEYKSDEFQNMIMEGSCLVTGFAGSGKTWLLTRIRELIFKQNGINEGDTDTLKGVEFLAFTGKAVDVLRKRGIQEARTLDAFIKLRKKNKNILAQIIVVDEVSMLSSYHIGVLRKWKSEGAQILMFGDFSQCQPVEDNCYDYLNNQTFRELADHKHFKLTYKPQLARFEQKTYDIALKLRDEGVYTGKLSGSEVNLEISNHICYTNRKKDNINQSIVEDRFEEFFDGKCIEKSCVYMCLKNDKELGVFNGQMFEFQKLEEQNVELMIQGTKNTISIPFNYFKKNFDYGYCRTVYKCQGDTIEGKIQIHEASIMSRAEFFTAITRTVNIKNVRINKTRIFYEETKPKQAYIRKAHKLEEGHLFDSEGFAYIYKITLPNQMYYIGKTTRDVQSRFKEHIDQKKYLKDSFHQALTELSDRELKKLEIEILEKFIFKDVAELDNLEKKHINEIQDNQCLNTFLVEEAVMMSIVQAKESKKMIEKPKEKTRMSESANEKQTEKMTKTKLRYEDRCKERTRAEAEERMKHLLEQEREYLKIKFGY